MWVLSLWRLFGAACWMWILSAETRSVKINKPTSAVSSQAPRADEAGGCHQLVDGKCCWRWSEAVNHACRKLLSPQILPLALRKASWCCLVLSYVPAWSQFCLGSALMGRGGKSLLVNDTSAWYPASVNQLFCMKWVPLMSAVSDPPLTQFLMLAWE